MTSCTADSPENQLSDETNDNNIDNETQWQCAACTMINNTATATNVNQSRCFMCNTPRDYIRQQRKSIAEKVAAYKVNYADFKVEMETTILSVSDLVSFFHPFPSMKGVNSGGTAVSEVVSDRIFLSGSFIAQDIQWLTENGITAILNCAATDIKHSEEVYSYGHGIWLLQLPINDTEKDMVLLRDRYLEQAIEFIQSEVGNAIVNDNVNDNGNINNNKILIHCSAGVSRSATILIAYLMGERKWSVFEAFAVVRSKRRFVYPNAGFWEMLIEIDRKNNNQQQSKGNKKYYGIVGNMMQGILDIHTERITQITAQTATTTQYSSVRNQKIRIW